MRWGADAGPQRTTPDGSPRLRRNRRPITPSFCSRSSSSLADSPQSFKAARVCSPGSAGDCRGSGWGPVSARSAAPAPAAPRQSTSTKVAASPGCGGAGGPRPWLRTGARADVASLQQATPLLPGPGASERSRPGAHDTRRLTALRSILQAGQIFRFGSDLSTATGPRTCRLHRADGDVLPVQSLVCPVVGGPAPSRRVLNARPSA